MIGEYKVVIGSRQSGALTKLRKSEGINAGFGN